MTNHNSHVSPSEEEEKKTFTAHWKITFTLLKQDVSADISQSPLKQKQLSVLKDSGVQCAKKKKVTFLGTWEKRIAERMAVH